MRRAGGCGDGRILGWQPGGSLRQTRRVRRAYLWQNYRRRGVVHGVPNDGRWQDDPYSLKMLGDLMFCQGVNRYFFHRYAMQPWTNRWPGMTMGPFGINFERTETWWKAGKAWIDYISHCQFLLQQGRAVADAAYFDSQSAPVETRVGNPPLPAGYDYDAVDADVLLHGATVKNGRITLASGANYAVLILPPDDMNMTPQMLQCIRKLVRAGATVVGPRPSTFAEPGGLSKMRQAGEKIAGELWGHCDGANVRENSCGKGRIIWGESLADVFAAQNLKPDFEFQGASDGTHLAYVHRVAGEADIYFVSNQRRQFDSADCTFRVSGKVPELWHPDTGVIEPAPVWSAANGRTSVRWTLIPLARSSSSSVALPATRTTSSPSKTLWPPNRPCRSWRFSTRFTGPLTARTGGT